MLANTTAFESTVIGNETASFSHCSTTVAQLSVGSSKRYSRRSSKSAGLGVTVKRTASSFCS
jgi:hypothetical protein